MTLDDLRKIAEAATPGEWVRDGISVLGAREEHDLNTGLARLATMMMPWERERMEANAEFIATFNPSKVLELLDEIGHLREQVETREKIIVEGSDSYFELAARLAAVEKLHYPALMPKPRGGALKVCAHCARQMHAVEKRAVWPCDTIKAARGE